jgi:hypothetical protein
MRPDPYVCGKGEDFLLSRLIVLEIQQLKGKGLDDTVTLKLPTVAVDLLLEQFSGLTIESKVKRHNSAQIPNVGKVYGKSNKCDIVRREASYKLWRIVWIVSLIEPATGRRVARVLLEEQIPSKKYDKSAKILNCPYILESENWEWAELHEITDAVVAVPSLEEKCCRFIFRSYNDPIFWE